MFNLMDKICAMCVISVARKDYLRKDKHHVHSEV